MPSRRPARASAVVPVQMASSADTSFDLLGRNCTTAREGSCNGCGPGRRRMSSDGHSEIDVLKELWD
jgi:hypothetical protein